MNSLIERFRGQGREREGRTVRNIYIWGADRGIKKQSFVR